MKKLSLVLSAASVMVVAPALASSGGGGGLSGGGFGVSQSRDPRAAVFSKGKRAFKKRITCKKCAYNGWFADSKTAREVAAKVKASEFNVKDDQRRAVLFLCRKDIALPLEPAGSCRPF